MLLLRKGGFSLTKITIVLSDEELGRLKKVKEALEEKLSKLNGVKLKMSQANFVEYLTREGLEKYEQVGTSDES